MKILDILVELRMKQSVLWNQYLSTGHQSLADDHEIIKQAADLLEGVKIKL